MSAQMRTTSTTAVVSLVCGILCWVALPFVAAIVAVVCGHIARGEIRRAAPGSIDGDGMAVAGLILGYLHLALIAAAVLFVFGVLGGLVTLANWHW